MDAWRILKKDFQGSEKVISIKLQSLWREFNNLFIEDNESVQTFFYKACGIINQIRTYWDTIEDKRIVQKILRSRPSKFEHVVASNEEAKDSSQFSLHELMNSLEAYEVRMSGFTEHSTE